MTADQVDTLTNALAAGGFRLTASRRAIIHELVSCGGHLSADDLARRVRSTKPSIGRMTVYRTLDLLNMLGLVRPVYQGTGAAHFILMEQGGHHHLVCDRCGATIEFDECHSQEISQVLSAQFNFEIQSHLLEFHGVCASCKSS